jgi:phosphate transport system ATP-binding protein
MSTTVTSTPSGKSRWISAAMKSSAMIGPSGCGKSTFLRCLNRMNDTIDICRVTGTITLDGQNIYDKGVDVVPLRAQVGMVFQKAQPVSQIHLREHRLRPANPRPGSQPSAETDEVVETSLKQSRAVGRGQGPPGQPGHRACPAASSSACASPAPSPWTRGDPDGRALLRPGPHRHRQIEDLIDELRSSTPSSSSPTPCSRRRGYPSARPIFTWVISSKSERRPRFLPTRATG